MDVTVTTSLRVSKVPYSRFIRVSISLFDLSVSVYDPVCSEDIARVERMAQLIDVP